MESPFNIATFLDKIKRKEKLTRDEINEFTQQVTNKQIPNYQISAFLMAVAINGMTEDEIFWFTDAMTLSGKIFNLTEEKKHGLFFIDKHSSGGVGDKMTITLAPLIASVGLTLLKGSGRGLGFTGGTIDKIESVGIRTKRTFREILTSIAKSNICVFSATKDLAPAEGIFYALRDVTSTVESTALIASSVMSKKLAFGNEYLFLDVKYGSGSFCKTYEAAVDLARMMTAIGKSAGRNVVTHITSMQQPLGNAVGNAIEVREVQRLFKGEQVSSDYRDLVIQFVGDIFVTTGRASSIEDARRKILALIRDGSALKAMERWIEAQGGDVESFRDESYFDPEYKKDVIAPKSGYFGIIDNSQIGHISCSLGAGRTRITDTIDFQAGIYVHKKINDLVKEGEVIYTLYSSNPIDPSLIQAALDNTLITPEKHGVDAMIMKYED